MGEFHRGQLVTYQGAAHTVIVGDHFGAPDTALIMPGRVDLSGGGLDLGPSMAVHTSNLEPYEEPQDTVSFTYICTLSHGHTLDQTITRTLMGEYLAEPWESLQIMQSAVIATAAKTMGVSTELVSVLFLSIHPSLSASEMAGR